MKNWREHYKLAEACLSRSESEYIPLDHKKYWAAKAQAHAALAQIQFEPDKS